MYLIHARLTGPPGLELPDDLKARLRAQATGEISIEHVTPHPDAQGGPILGLFVTAPSLDEAERAAKDACLRVLRSYPDLAGCGLDRCGAAFVAPVFEAEFRWRPGRGSPGRGPGPGLPPA
ncbi:hypothetical protein [Streptomyces sp. CO7]